MWENKDTEMNKPNLILNQNNNKGFHDYKSECLPYLKTPNAQQNQNSAVRLIIISNRTSIVANTTPLLSP